MPQYSFPLLSSVSAKFAFKIARKCSTSPLLMYFTQKLLTIRVKVIGHVSWYHRPGIYWHICDIQMVLMSIKAICS